MKKIGTGFKLFEEEEEEEEDDTTVHHHPSLPSDSRRFGSSEIRITLSLIQENHGGTLVLEDDDGDRTLGLPAAVPRNSHNAASPVYSPMPLRWFHPDFNFPSDQINLPYTVDRVGESVLDDHDGGVDTTLRLSTASTSRKPNRSIVINPRNSGSGSNDVNSPIVDEDEVNTELSLSLGLSPLGCKKEKSIKQEKRGRSDGEAGASEDGTEKKKKRRITKRNRENGEDQRPSVPIEEIPMLQQTLESRGGTRPVFLYQKKLEESDVLKDQNRLLVTRAERVMEFLREEESAAVNAGPGNGLKFVGVDGGGRVYEKMGLTKWAKSKVTVINSDWRKVVEANGAKRGDVMEIWGYRENEKLCFAFNFV